MSVKEKIAGDGRRGTSQFLTVQPAAGLCTVFLFLTGGIERKVLVAAAGHRDVLRGPMCLLEAIRVRC